MSKVKEILRVSDDEIDRIRMHHGMTAEDVRRDIGLLREWLKQQPHLPHDEDDYLLETLLIANKCRVEKTKEKLENLYTFRTLYPDMMAYYDIEGDLFKSAFETFLICFLPSLTPNLERCIYIRIRRPDLFVVQHIYGLCMVIDFLRNNDYSLSIVFVFDWSGVTFDIVKRLDLAVLQRIYNVMMNALSGKFTHVILLNTPTFGDVVFKMLRLIFKPDLYGRIKSHASMESVFEIIPREMAPKDYGGDGESIDELERKVKEEVPYHGAFFRRIAARRSDERLRTEAIKTNDLFGSEGTFKRLNLD